MLPRTATTLAATVLVSLLGLACSPALGQNFATAVPYQMSSDSRVFGALKADSMYFLEDFEDGMVNTPHLMVDANPDVMILPPGPNTDSVDLDDGALDGLGTAGYSLGNSATGIVTLIFEGIGNPAVYPTQVGFVWTDGQANSNILFTVISKDGFPASVFYNGLGDGSQSGTTDEDRFISVEWSVGISQITVAASSSLLEIDHVQYQYPMELDYYMNDNCNGDLMSDLVWHRPSTGAVSTWNMNGLARIGGGAATQSTPLTWEFQGLGDLDGDSFVDVLWRDSVTKVFHGWLMNGQTVSSSGPIAGAGTPNASWEVLALADLDRDLCADLLLRNTATGSVNWWKLQGLAKVGGGVVGNAGMLEFIGTPDLNGDGHHDILWRGADGTMSGWLLSDGQAYAMDAIGNANPINAIWVPSAVGDIDGDGRDDVIWRNTVTGVVNAWLMNGLYKVGGGAIGTIALDWTLNSTTDLNGDGNEDLIWTNVATGKVNGWLMDGLVKLQGGTIQTLNLGQWNLLNG